MFRERALSKIRQPSIKLVARLYGRNRSALPQGQQPPRPLLPRAATAATTTTATTASTSGSVTGNTNVTTTTNSSSKNNGSDNRCFDLAARILGGFPPGHVNLPQLDADITTAARARNADAIAEKLGVESFTEVVAAARYIKAAQEAFPWRQLRRDAKTGLPRLPIPKSYVTKRLLDCTLF